MFEWYKKQFGDLKVKTQFVIPPDAEVQLPEHVFKKNRLGEYVQHIRRHLRGAKNSNYCEKDLTELKEMGFVENTFDEKNRCVLLAFNEYKDRFGNCNVLESFKIPKNDLSWSKDVRGLNLGIILRDIRNRAQHKNIHDDLSALGVDLGSQNAGIDFERTYTALTSYKSVHGHVKVPFSFLVPENDARYPEETWRVKLGIGLYNIRCRGRFAEHRDRLVALGVDFEVKHQVGFDVIYSALVAYKSVNGHVKVPQKFVVPMNDSAYPESSWGLKLGAIVWRIRKRGNYAEHREKLVALGVDFKV